MMKKEICGENSSAENGIRYGTKYAIDRQGQFRSKAVKYFVAFLVFMLFCTIISRGIYAYQMPQVTIGRGEKRSIVHEVEASGSVTAAGEYAVLLPEGMRVEEILVREGQSVEPETALLRVSITELTEAMEELKTQIAILEQRLAEFDEAEKQETQKQKTEAARAKEDLDNVSGTQELLVQQARKRYEEAKNLQDTFPNFDVYYATQIRQDSQYQEMAKDPLQQEAFQQYVTAIQLTHYENWKNEGKALENSTIEAEKALQLAENDRNLAILQARRNLEDSQKEAVETKSNRMEQEQNIQILKKQLAQCQEMKQQEGQVRSSVKGSVQEIRIGVGDRTADTAAMVLSDSEKGCFFEVLLDGEQIKYFNPDEPVTIKIQKDNRRIRDCQVVAFQKTEGEAYQITAALGEEKLSLGELGTLEISKQEGPFSCCVPLEAIQTINNNSYLYIIRETDTILGTELRIVRRQVKVLDQNGSYVALEEGTLGEEEQFVLESTKELAEGDTVRRKEIEFLQ